MSMIKDIKKWSTPFMPPSPALEARVKRAAAERVSMQRASFPDAPITPVVPPPVIKRPTEIEQMEARVRMYDTGAVPPGHYVVTSLETTQEGDTTLSKMTLKWQGNPVDQSTDERLTPDMWAKRVSAELKRREDARRVPIEADYPDENWPRG